MGRYQFDSLVCPVVYMANDGGTNNHAASTFFSAHRALLEEAAAATRRRGYWSPFPEAPSDRIYGDTARHDADERFRLLLGQPFDLNQPWTGNRIGKEISPWGFDLGITYPEVDASLAISTASVALPRWGAASLDDRVGVLLEFLVRLNRASFLMANAVMHTSGQPFGLAFQAGGPHAHDRALEALAYAYEEMKRVPRKARWEKPQRTGDPIVLEKTYRIIPRGLALVVGCSTFPTWNSYPGLFASLVTGNAVIVKPHPGAILPLALAVNLGRVVLDEAGYDPNVLLLAADEAKAPLTKALALDPGINIIDFTGSSAFGQWLRENAKAQAIYTEETGVNSVVVDATDNFKGMCKNLAFSLSLYSGQMCTSPQNIYVPAAGIMTEEGRKSFDEVAVAIAQAIDDLVVDPDRAAGVLGAIQADATLNRVTRARDLADIVRDSAPFAHHSFGTARTATPLVLRADATDDRLYMEEHFGPISFIVRTPDTAQSIELAARSARTKGAITAAIYATREDVLNYAASAFARVGVPLSCNLTGGVFVNQSAAFSDYHVTGANPAGNACLVDTAFVANRFRVATVRRPA